MTSRMVASVKCISALWACTGRRLPATRLTSACTFSWTSGKAAMYRVNHSTKADTVSVPK